MARDNLGVAPSATTDLIRKTDLDAHINDTTAAHAASAISFSPTGDIAATDVQAAIAELLSEAFPIGWGPWASWVPVLSQGGTVTATVNEAKYTMIGKTVLCKVRLTVTGTGTAASTVTVTPPLAPTATANIPGGGGFVFDTSANNTYPGQVVVDTTGVMRMVSTNNGSNVGQSLPFNVALAAGDVVNMSATYEIP